MASHFLVHETNPNDQVGGGGCLCSGGAVSEDCDGKWIHFFRVSTEFDASPYAVICEKHLAEVVEGVPFEEVLAAGDVHPLRAVKRDVIAGPKIEAPTPAAPVK